MTAWNALLARAESALSRRAFVDAQRRAEALLQAPLPHDIRGRALMVAGDAAYANRAYVAATRHYGAFVTEYSDGPEASRVAMALGWARLRSRDREGARAAWSAFADSRPDDARTPMALVLAAELAGQAGDMAAAEQSLDRLVTQYPSSGPAGSGRLSRACLLLERKQETAALRHLVEVIGLDGPTAIDDRRKISQAIVTGDDTVWIPMRNASGMRRDGGDPIDPFARRLLSKEHHEESPYLLHGVALLAAQRGEANALAAALASRLVKHFPSYGPGSELLVRVADVAAARGQWPLARHSLETLLTHAPTAIGRAERLMLAKAQLQTGATPKALKHLEELAAGSGDEAPQALALLAQAHTAAGDRRAALRAHDRLQRDYPRYPRSARALLLHAQLLDDLGPRERARPMLQKVVELSEGDVAAEAAYRLGQSLSAEGHHATAVEWYLTAAYAAEQSTWGRHALLGAGQSLTMLNETKEALAVYWKLLPGETRAASVADHDVAGEAAYRAGEILRAAELYSDALALFLTSARLTSGLAAERRALLSALQCAAKAGDGEAAEGIYRRLQGAGANEMQLAQARQTLHQNGVPNASSPAPAMPRLAP
jgi:tetratricopeptide (TPR) repeat protein